MSTGCSIERILSVTGMEAALSSLGIGPVMMGE
jgi:hypothetical protein